MRQKPQKPMMPSIFHIEEGAKKYIYGRYEVETIINALYKDLSEVQVGKNTVHIKKQHKSDDEWWVEVEIS